MSTGPQTEPVVRHRDERGDLVKIWPRAVAGEVYAVELRPGAPRGHHVHQRGGEWFMALVGRVVLVVVDVETGERWEHVLGPAPDGEHRVRVEPNQAHALWAVGDGPAWVVAIADFGYEDEVTVPHLVEAPGHLFAAQP